MQGVPPNFQAVVSVSSKKSNDVSTGMLPLGKTNEYLSPKTRSRLGQAIAPLHNIARGTVVLPDVLKVKPRSQYLSMALQVFAVCASLRGLVRTAMFRKVRLG